MQELEDEISKKINNLETNAYLEKRFQSNKSTLVTFIVGQE